jgi:hypothetical protein
VLVAGKINVSHELNRIMLTGLGLSLTTVSQLSRCLATLQQTQSNGSLSQIMLSIS